MQVSERVWRVALYVAAAVALALGAVQAVREAKLGAALSPGTPTPALEGTRLDDGKPFTLAQVQNKVVLLSFWASWCGPCRRELPVLQKLASEFRDQGLALVTVNRDEGDDRAELASGVLKELGGTAPLVVFPSDRAAEDWHAGTLPTLYLLGRDGQIRLGHSGSLAEGTLRKEIELALKAP